MLQIKRHSAAFSRQPDQYKYVPLKRVTVEATVRSFAADVIIRQIFRNDETTPIEAVYCFPIEEQAAVYSFIARIDDREIVAQLKEKHEAQKEYNDALQQGHGAYLFEQDEKSQDNFVINIGALPPGKECHISISYVSELDLVQNGKKIRFIVPTTIAPRYNPDKGGISSPAGTTSKYVQNTPYTIEFRCRIEKVGISRVSLISHPNQIEFGEQDTYVIEFAQENTHLDRDIILDIELTENHSNTIIAVESGAIMAAFTPTEEDCQRAINAAETTNEFIFVVDCSGSMEHENKIGLARQAMLLFLKSLPVDCQFNIIRFGSRHETLFTDITAVYNEENARNAEQLTNNLNANLGGTELLGPLQWLEEHPPGQGRARQIFLLTDGEISNVDQVLDLCRSMATSTRIFSFGLGHSPSRSLVKGLARATNGRFVFIPPNSSVDVYVGEQLQKALQSCITNVQITWNLGTSVTSIPTKTPPVYVNDRLIVYALADGQTLTFDHNSHVELHSNQHRLCEAKVHRLPSVSNDGSIARLAAKALILELQHSKLVPSPPKKNTASLQSRFQEHQQSTTTTMIDQKETIKKRIIELSLKHNILSPHTAFIGVEKRANASNADMVLREVPIQISADGQDSEEYRPIQQYCMPTSSMMPMSMTKDCIQLHSLSTISPESNQYFSQCAFALDREEIRCYSASKTYSSECDDEEMEPEYVSTSKREENLFTNDQDIVRYLINKQKFDGLWDLDEKIIEQLTGKSLTSFAQSSDPQILISAIVIVALETRFASLSTMWHGVVQKARKRLLHLLDKDAKKLDSLLKSIHQQL